MKKLIVILLFITSPLHAEKIERLGFYNLQEILEDDNLTYKIIKGCVSINSAVTELIKDEHPDLADEFFKSAHLSACLWLLPLSQDFSGTVIVLRNE